MLYYVLVLDLDVFVNHLVANLLLIDENLISFGFDSFQLLTGFLMILHSKLVYSLVFFLLALGLFYQVYLVTGSSVYKIIGKFDGFLLSLLLLTILVLQVFESILNQHFLCFNFFDFHVPLEHKKTVWVYFAPVPKTCDSKVTYIGYSGAGVNLSCE